MGIVEFVMKKVLGDKVSEKGVPVGVGFTLSKIGSARQILSSRVT